MFYFLPRLFTNQSHVFFYGLTMMVMTQDRITLLLDCFRDLNFRIITNLTLVLFFFGQGLYTKTLISKRKEALN